MRDFDFVDLVEVRKLIAAHKSETHVLREVTVYDRDEEGYPYPVHCDEVDVDEDGWTPEAIASFGDVFTWLRESRRRVLSELLTLGETVYTDAELDARLDDPTVLFDVADKSYPAARLCEVPRDGELGLGDLAAARTWSARAAMIARAIGVRPGDALYSHRRLQDSQSRFCVTELRPRDPSHDHDLDYLVTGKARRFLTWFELVRIRLDTAC